MTILVTGASGFVGGHVVAALRADGRELRALVRDPARARDVDAELVQGDMTDPASLRNAIAGCDTVIHLVAIRQGKPEQFRRIMIDGTRALIAAAKDAGVERFILMSALGTSAATKDLVPYYNAKWTEEQDVEASGLPYVIFRPSFISKAVDLDGATNRTFELGGPDAVSWNEFWERLKRVRGIRRPSVHVPIGLMRLNALVTERLPGDIPLTRDLLKMLEAGDNVVTDSSAVETFGLPLVALDEQLRLAA